MPEEEDHRFKRITIENKHAEQVEVDKFADEDKARRFQWDHIEDEETKRELLDVSEKEINECASTLAAHLLTHITTEHFGGADVSGMQFVIPVDLDLHHLLQKRFEEKWDLGSRLEMFDMLRLVFSAKFGEEKRVELDAKIQDILPSTHRKKFISGKVSLEDDAMVVDDESNMVSIEIPVDFAAN